MATSASLRSRSTRADIDWIRNTHNVFPSGDHEKYEPDDPERLRLWTAEARDPCAQERQQPMSPTGNPFAVVIAFGESPLSSGSVSIDNRDALAGTPSLIAERPGDGSVVLFVGMPNFRGYGYGTNKLFLNAQYFSKAFDAPEEDADDR